MLILYQSSIKEKWPLDYDHGKISTACMYRHTDNLKIGERTFSHVTILIAHCKWNWQARRSFCDINTAYRNCLKPRFDLQHQFECLQ